MAAGLSQTVPLFTGFVWKRDIIHYHDRKQLLTLGTPLPACICCICSGFSSVSGTRLVPVVPHVCSQSAIHNNTQPNEAPHLDATVRNTNIWSSGPSGGQGQGPGRLHSSQSCDFSSNLLRATAPNCSITINTAQKLSEVSCRQAFILKVSSHHADLLLLSHRRGGCLNAAGGT